MKRKSFWKGFGTGLAATITCIMLTLSVSTFTGVINWEYIFPSSAASAERGKITAKASEINAYINKFYLNDVDQEKMEDGIYSGMLEGLNDDYAAYYNKADYAALKEKTSGNYCGIGAYVSQDTTTGAISIVQPIKGGPADKAGIKAKDIIYSVDGTKVTGKDLSTVVATMKGDPGTKVKLQILRKGESDYLDFAIERKKIETKTVTYEMLDNKIGYIQVTSFEETTVKQFKQALAALNKKGQKSLIIDLRDNGGGLLNTAIKMLDQILPKELVVYTKDKDGKTEKYYATDKGTFNKPIAILVNENSASASEVFSGAMQDYKKGILVGTTTFGKGIVQSVFNLSDGTALKLTTSKYYTPKGRNIHGTGLTPDIAVTLNDKTTVQKKSGFVIDNQLKAAINALSK